MEQALVSRKDVGDTTGVLVNRFAAHFLRALAMIFRVADAAQNISRRERVIVNLQVRHGELHRRDPVSANRLNPNDRTRVARALEVIEATGRSLTDWQQEGLPALIDPARTVRVFIAPDRAALYGRIDARFATMLAGGALDEVRKLAARRLDPLLPAMKAHGVPWLIRHLAGEIPLAAAADKARQDTRHYAKRQFTWFRHQLGDWPALAPETAYDALARALGAEAGQPNPI